MWLRLLGGDTSGEVNLFLVKGILVFQACVIVYYVFNIALNFLRYVLSWNSSFKKGAPLPLQPFTQMICCKLSLPRQGDPLLTWRPP